jgi:hypothetical protein
MWAVAATAPATTTTAKPVEKVFMCLHLFKDAVLFGALFPLSLSLSL